VRDCRLVTRATGYLLVLTATTLFGLNGPVSKVVLQSGLDSGQLTEVRVTGAFVLLAAFLLATRPQALRASPRQMIYLVVFGLVGLNAVQVLYFLAIRELPVGVALLVEYLAPVIVALYARFFLGERSGRALWAALGLVLLGLALMVELFSGELTLSGIGLTYAFMAAFAYAIYILMTEQIIHERPPVATICWGFGVAAVFWAVVRPWWDFPWDTLTSSAHLGGHLEAYSPVAAGLIAWMWLGETLSTGQAIGAALIVSGILLAESATSLQISH
jgi:drug/metabolite transporter (DMT)-like permease